MRKDLLLLLLLIPVLPGACDGVPGANLRDTDALDTDADTDTGDTYETSQGLVGTQVGSEGLFGCRVTRATWVDDPLAVAQGFTESPSVLVAARSGEWIVAITTPTAGTTGTLSLTPTGVYEMVGVEETTGCRDYIRGVVDGRLVTGTVTDDVWAGSVAVRTDRSVVALTEPAAAAQLGMAPTFDTTGMSSVDLHLDAELSDTELSGTFAFIGCTGTTCTAPDPAGTLIGSR